MKRGPVWRIHPKVTQRLWKSMVRGKGLSGLGEEDAQGVYLHFTGVKLWNDSIQLLSGQTVIASCELPERWSRDVTNGNSLELHLGRRDGSRGRLRVKLE